MKKTAAFYAKTKGFTLIELIIVIAIIGILSSIVLTNLTTSKYKADDARREQDMKAMRTALELYGEKNAYDYSALFSSPSGNHTNAECSLFDHVAGQMVALKYLPAIPVDPRDTSAGPTCYHMWEAEHSSYGTIVAAYALEWQNYHNVDANRKTGFVVSKTGNTLDVAAISCGGDAGEGISAFSYPIFDATTVSCTNSSGTTDDQIIGTSAGN